MNYPPGRLSFGLSASLLVLPAAATEPVLLDTLTVSERHVEESATGPVQGYRANRSSTATKTDTDIRDTPQSIAVVPSQVLEDLNSTRIDRALDFAGGVSRAI